MLSTPSMSLLSDTLLLGVVVLYVVLCKGQTDLFNNNLYPMAILHVIQL